MICAAVGASDLIRGLSHHLWSNALFEKFELTYFVADWPDEYPLHPGVPVGDELLGEILRGPIASRSRSISGGRSMIGKILSAKTRSASLESSVI